MAKAMWNGQVVAESDKTEVVEGNQYFPPDSVKKEYLQPSDKETICPWKGTANYYNVVVGGKVNENAAWCYANPKDAAKRFKHYVAFWNGVEVEA